jgi:catechol-2,3-dioxygenase
MKIRLQTLAIPARHFENTVQFYRDTLQLEVAYQREGVCALKASGVQLTIHRAEANSPFAPTGRGIYLDFFVESVLQTKRLLEAARVPIEREWSDTAHKYLLVADPEGNLTEFIEPLKAGT